MLKTNQIADILGKDASLLEFSSPKIGRDSLTLPGADTIDRVFAQSDRNKRAGGSGLILGRKAFQKPLAEGISLLQAVQSVYLDDSITIA